MVQAMHHYGQPLEVLFYEVLDMPLREYEQLKHMKARPSLPHSSLSPFHSRHNHCMSWVCCNAHRDACVLG